MNLSRFDELSNFLKVEVIHLINFMASHQNSNICFKTAIDEMKNKLEEEWRNRNDTDEEFDVDDVESPNVYPYKKCYSCEERKSCGSYTNDGWFCEDCYTD